jgi:hypothetical protein
VCGSPLVRVTREGFDTDRPSARHELLDDLQRQGDGVAVRAEPDQRRGVAAGAGAAAGLGVGFFA